MAQGDQHRASFRVGPVPAWGNFSGGLLPYREGSSWSFQNSISILSMLSQHREPAWLAEPSTYAGAGCRCPSTHSTLWTVS